ncbi:hypothetical protein POVWA1_023110 [Plasmodium ovale wallikeri]|uniref:Uncharacterized protein n=1 Tax=Plasmodium ovale wallikeri TaxID=864142 RepID=A0A1A8YT62_PLAOA|nr:hypothetical protein POVWA1_023110 [Plasmodium ovale wallikeri]
MSSYRHVVISSYRHVVISSYRHVVISSYRPIASWLCDFRLFFSFFRVFEKGLCKSQEIWSIIYERFYFG